MKTFVAYVRSILRGRNFMLNVHAEEPKTEPNTGTEPPAGNEPPATTPTPDPTPAGTVHFEELIAKARREERDKLYPQLDKLKEKNNNLTLVIAERDKEFAALKKSNGDLESKSTKLAEDLKEGTATNKTVSELTSQITILENEKKALQDKYDKDLNDLKLNSFKEKAIASANGALIPELVTGATEEEITASVEASKARYAEITSSVQNQQQAQVLPTANPSATQIQIGQNLSMEEIAGMNTQDWAKARAQLGLK